MTDLEITKLCAEAMRYEPVVTDTDHVFPIGTVLHNGPGITYVYDPLHDDAQAMALVKKFQLRISTYDDEELAWLETNERKKGWRVWPPYKVDEQIVAGDLNRSICECVAKMQAAKASAPSAAVRPNPAG